MISSWLDDFDPELAALDRHHLRRRRAVVTSAAGARMTVDGRDMVGFCSNDYLGLSRHPALIRAACEGAKAYGVGAGGSPLVSGHSAANASLEHDLATFVGLPRALYFYAGFSTNTGIVPALAGPGDAVFSDALNHASLIDGIRLSRAEIHRYPHADLTALGHALAHSAARRKLIVSDAVFSMDGTCADIGGLLMLCERYDALLLLDDAHGFGVLGPDGRGSLAQSGFVGVRASRRVLYMATLRKAAGAAGAFVAGDSTLIDWLIQKTRSYIYATAAPPMLAVVLRASLGVIQQEQWRRDYLNLLIGRLRTGLAQALHASPWTLTDSTTPIQPLLIGSNGEALKAMQALRQNGIWVPAIRPPTVPVNTARLRIVLSAAHTERDVDQLIDVLATHAQAVT